MKMTRRSAFALAGAAALPFSSGPARAAAGRLKQSAARWCYDKIPLDDLCKHAVRIGLKGIDLLEPPDWPVVQKYGLVTAMAKGGGTIPDGWNRKEYHPKLLAALRERIPLAAKYGIPNIIALAGNRRGMSDAEGMDNVVAGLSQVKALAEDKGVTICMELLNSKVDHKDYICDHTAWGVEVVKRLNSPRIKLLYDIYHMQIMEGDVIRTIKENIQYFGHFHTGGVPGRHEIDNTQELNYRPICEAIVASGYTGYLAHEFVPVHDPIQSLEAAYKLCDV